MRPEISEYSKEIGLEEAVKFYTKGELVVLRFHNGNDWYAEKCQQRIFSSKFGLEDITLDMLPHIRYFVKGA